MLTSLFGDLGLAKRRQDDEAWKDTEADLGNQGFAATSLLESTDTTVNDQGQMVDRHVRDLLIRGSAARAMREHFASRPEGDGSSHAITLYDPMKVWAPAVIKALSDASGQPIEKLHLREKPTLKTIAMIERTRVVRRFDETLKIYHADVRVLEAGTADIPIVLMERSELAAVIVGPMHGDAVEHMLSQLVEATRQPSWRCATLLFMLPPTDVWIAEDIAHQDWPAGIRVTTLHDSLSSTSAVWNALLDAWNGSRTAPDWSRTPTGPGDGGFPIRVAELEASQLPSAGSAVAANAPRLGSWLPVPDVIEGLDAQRAAEGLRGLIAANDGVLGCGVVDEDGVVIAIEQREQLELSLSDAASACTQLLRAQRQAARAMGLPEPMDEAILGAGGRQQVLRPLARHPGTFLFALIDRGETNLALVRYRMREIERELG